MMNWFQRDVESYQHAPIDEETRITLRDMLRFKDVALQKEDFEAVKIVTENIKKVFELGTLIWNFRRELQQCISKEDFSRAIDLKNQIKKMEAKRDGFDALYETSRYENMVVLDRPSTAEYWNLVQ